MPAMPKWSLLLPVVLLAASASAQAPPSAIDMANLQEDVRGLTQRVNELSLRVEQLEHQNNEARPSGEAASQGYATLVQLNAAVADVPKTGISYVVQKGDTVELIAKKAGAKAQDIIKFNKLADPSLIRVGQSLFIPGGK